MKLFYTYTDVAWKRTIRRHKTFTKHTYTTRTNHDNLQVLHKSHSTLSDHMDYYDPYQDPYGGYDPYGGDPYGDYQEYEEAPPPAPSPDWEDVTKRNQSYTRKINKSIIQEDFKHIKTETLFAIEAMVQFIEINEDLLTNQETNEKIDEDKIVVSLKFMDSPLTELAVPKDDEKAATVVSLRAHSRNAGNPNTGDSQRTISTKQNMGDSQRTISTKQNMGESQRTISTKQNMGESQRTISTKQNTGDSQRTISTKQNMGESQRTISTKQSTGDSQRTVIGKQNTRDSERSLSKAGKKTNTVVSERRDSKMSGKLRTVFSDQSALTQTPTSPSMSDMFQTLLARLAKKVESEKVQELPEVVEEEPEEKEGYEENAEGGEENYNYDTANYTGYDPNYTDYDPNYTDYDPNYTNYDSNWQEGQEEVEPPNRVKIDINKGISKILLKNGYVMIQKLQAAIVDVVVGCRAEYQVEDEVVNNVTPIGLAGVTFPTDFQQAVLRRGAAKAILAAPILGVNDEDYGLAVVELTLISMGQGVDVGLFGDPGVYGPVKLIKEFTPEKVQSIFDPPVHPRLAVTIMNLEPPLGLNSTSAEIIQNAVNSNLISLEGEEGSYLRNKLRKCRWLDIARGTRTPSKSSLSSRIGLSLSSDTSCKNFPTLIDFDPELGVLWRQIKRDCKKLPEEVEALKNQKKALLDELEVLLEDKVKEDYESEAASTAGFKPSQEEERTSKASRISKTSKTSKESKESKSTSKSRNSKASSKKRTIN